MKSVSQLLGGARTFLSAPVYLLLAFSALQVNAAPFRGGAAAVDISPTSLPIRTAGNLTLTVVSNIHDSLHSRALVLDDGAIRLAIVAVDTCMIAREDFDAARAIASHATGIPVENMLISSTHTHTAPAS